MAEFNKAVITQKGLALITKSTISNNLIEFTKIETGDGSYLAADDLSKKSSLINKKQEFPIASWEKEDDTTVRLRTLVINTDLSVGYYIKEIGLFANDPDEGQILYSIIMATTDKWDFVPAANDFKIAISIDIYTTVSNINMVSILRSEESYALAEDLEELKDETRKHVNNADIHLSISEKAKYLDKYTKVEVDNKLSAIETNIDWKEAVNTFADIITTYSNPQDGWTVNVKDTDYTYRWTGTQWVAISANAIPKSTMEIDGLMSATQVEKLEKIATGAEVNQNAFSKVMVGNTTIEADTKTDILTLEAGSNITLTSDAANDKITIAANDATKLPLAGGEITGRVKLELDYYVHSARGTIGTAGYIHIAQIKISGSSQDAPVEFYISQRGTIYNTKVLVKFANEANADPKLEGFTYEGSNGGIYLYKSATSTWDLYVLKKDSYDGISIMSLKIPAYLANISVTWKDAQSTSVPDGSVKAVLATNNTNVTGNAKNVSGIVALENGGTGATTAAAARANLEAIGNAELAEIWKVVYPVGAIYMSTVATNPNILFSGGTWEAWGTGRVPIGVDTSDADFSAVEKTGGTKTETLTTSQMPAHTHTFTGNTVASGGQSTNHTHDVLDSLKYVAGTGAASIDTLWTGTTKNISFDVISTSGNASTSHTHTVTASGTNASTGGGSSHNNLQPFITCYMWKRTA